jgi:succinoglycan biosynthesis protein ExoW
VIMPYFQREAGILTRSLTSVKAQAVPADWLIEVIVVDDGSPVPAEVELRQVNMTKPFCVKVIRTANGGVGAARNRGLEEANPAGTLIAFLDSDDIWPRNHLSRAIEALGQGFDVYFTDNRREGHHESHCRSHFVRETGALLESSPQKTGLLDIPVDVMIGLSLKEFPCQASTVVYRRKITRGLRFDADLRSSGEDVLFFTCLMSAANRVCFDLDSMVECGAGVNIFFSNLGWDSERLLAIKVDSLVTHRRIAKRVELSDRNRAWNDKRIRECRHELAFHTLRNLVKNQGRVAREIRRLAVSEPGAVVALPVDMIRMSVCWVLRRAQL